MDTPKAFARLGLVYLEEAILVAMGDEALIAAKISKRLGILGYAQASNTERYKIVHGILQKLASEGRVEWYHHGSRWIRTDVEA